MLDNVDAALESAISSHEAGDLILAGEKYLEILKVDPGHPDANHNFGLLTVKLGEPAMGIQFFKTAIESNPTISEYEQPVSSIMPIMQLVKELSLSQKSFILINSSSENF